MKPETTFKAIIESCRKSFREFEKVEQREWGSEATMIELMKQVGDLSKKVMVYERYYLKDRETHPDYKMTKEDIGNELADILYCLVRLADVYGIDLEKANREARKEELDSLKKIKRR